MTIMLMLTGFPQRVAKEWEAQEETPYPYTVPILGSPCPGAKPPEGHG